MSDIDNSADDLYIPEDRPTIESDVRNFLLQCGRPLGLELKKEDDAAVASFMVRVESAMDDLIAAIGYLDRTATAQTAGDLIYIIIGMMVQFGLKPDDVLATVHRANLSRIDPNTGNPFETDSDGRVLKGPEYWDPFITIANLVD